MPYVKIEHGGGCGIRTLWNHKHPKPPAERQEEDPKKRGGVCKCVSPQMRCPPTIPVWAKWMWNQSTGPQTPKTSSRETARSNRNGPQQKHNQTLALSWHNTWSPGLSNTPHTAQKVD